MANRDFTPYQQKAIKRYYDNRPSIDRTKLSELVTNLYLADAGKAEKMWERAEDLMTRLEVPPARVKHVTGSRDVAALAKVVEELEKGG
ncbi:hypothetical protein [Alienimonas sp. DA493]|uniref:hypothetical protein n=1 Tax=Alienimonas sp. DA493 TaxID=3373605 RepID=UPI0037551876